MINSPLVQMPFTTYNGKIPVTQMQWVPQYRGAAQNTGAQQAASATQTVAPQTTAADYNWVANLNIPNYDVNQPYNVADRLKWLLPAAQAAAEQFWGSAKLPAGYGSSVSANRVRQETGDQAARMLALLTGIDQYGYNSAAYLKKLNQQADGDYYGGGYGARRTTGGGIMFMPPGDLQNPNWAGRSDANPGTGISYTTPTTATGASMNLAQNTGGANLYGTGNFTGPGSAGYTGGLAGAGFGGQLGTTMGYDAYPRQYRQNMYF